MLNLLKRYTGLLIRIDDIAENMNWELMDKSEKLFDKYKIKPLLGIIPENKDPELRTHPHNSEFWKRVKIWRDKGWEISMHGYTHVYSQRTKKKDYFNYGGQSEFFGLSYNSQIDRIKLGIKKFKDNGINVRSFFAPNHTYDINTFKALNDSGIKIVIDGYGLFPFHKFNLFFVPQLFYKEIILPIGIQATQIHLNNWNDKDFEKFEKLISKNSEKIVDIDYIYNLKSSNFFQKSLNYSLEKTLKTLRLFK